MVHFIDERWALLSKKYSDERRTKHFREVLICIKFQLKKLTKRPSLEKQADKLFLEKYMTELLRVRNRVVKEFAESDKWKEVLAK